jgi:hypothetical protein
MLVEVPDEAAVEWTRPEDFPVGEKELLKKTVGLRKGGVLTAFADGAPQFISDNIPPDVLREAMIRDLNDRRLSHNAWLPWARVVPPTWK